MDLLLEDNASCLQQGLHLLRSLDPEFYRRPQLSGQNASIGEHIRHNQDHYECFLRGWESGQIDYDARQRDERVSREVGHAVERMEDALASLRALPASALTRAVSVHMRSRASTEAATEPVCASTVGRELQFLLSHTIHHYALIAIFCRLEGVTVPDDFGVAPSTLRHRQAVAR